MDGPWRDIRWTWRRLARDRWFLATAVLTLAVGIGLNATVFGLVDRLAFEPLPVESPAELVSIYGTGASGAMTHGPISSRELERVRDEIGTFRGVVATTYAPMAVEQAGRHRLVLGERVTVDYFSLLGVEPALGRTFTLGEDDAPIVVLSDSAWRRHHGADVDILGRTIRVGGDPVTVVGVAPRGFTGLMHGIAPELWRPMRVAVSSPTEAVDEAAADRGWLWVTGRLAPGRSLSHAASEVDALTARLRREAPAAYDGYGLTAVARHRVRVLPGFDGALVAVSWIALGGVGLVLLIASANVASLQLARAVGRRREMATRLALGAGPARIVRQLFTESLVLAALGGAVGWLMALGAHRLLAAIRWPIPVDIDWGAALDGRVLVFTLLVSTGCAVLFGLAPAIETLRTDLTRGLRGLASGGRRSGRWRRGLVAVQIAVSLVLLIGAGLATRSLMHASRIDLGFEPDGVVVASFAPRSTTPRVETFYRRLLPRVEALPGVDAVGLASHLPLTLERRFERVDTGSGEGEGGAPWPQVESATFGPGAFEALGIERRQGRVFDAGDTADGAFVAVVNEAFVRRFWPETRTVVGRELAVDGIDAAYQVVGVVEDTKVRTLGEAPRPVLYLTFEQDRWRRRGHGGEITTGTETLVARVTGDPAPTLDAIRRLAGEVDADVAITRVGSLRDAIAPAVAPVRAAAGLFAGFGLLGLLLASIGLYGVMADATVRRTREIGIRMSLGARPRDIVGLVLRDGAAMTAVGLVLGWGVAWLASRLVGAFLYGIRATDTVAWGGVSVGLAIVALIACWLPARRAVATDPQVALRQD